MSGPRVGYGDVMLDLSDARYAHIADVASGHASPLVDFDPGDHPRLFLQDALIAEGLLSVDYGVGWRREVAGADATDKLLDVFNDDRVTWRRNDPEDDLLVAYLDALRDAVLLPLDAMHEDIARVLELAVLEAHRRIAVAAAAEKRGERYPDWRDVDLVADIAAFAGEGRVSGRSVWFHCPWHSDSDASLHVDPNRRLWHCFSCNRGGGVVDWRKSQENAA